MRQTQDIELKLTNERSVPERTKLLLELSEILYLSDTIRAIILLQELLANYSIFLSKENPNLIAQSCLQLTKCYVLQSKNEEASDIIIKAEQLFHEIGNQKGIIDCLNIRGKILLNQGCFTEASEVFRKCIEEYNSINEVSSEAQTHIYLGNVEAQIGNKEFALSNYMIALNKSKEINNEEIEASAISYIGLIEYESGDFTKSLQTLNEALEKLQRLDNLYGEANTVSNIGNLYLKIGDYPLALESHFSALTIRQKLSDINGQAASYCSIAQVYGALGEIENALEYERRSRDLYHLIHNINGESLALSNMGSSFLTLKNFPMAIEVLNESLLLSKQTKNKRIEFSALFNLGIIYGEIGEIKQAFDTLYLALNISQDLNNKALEADISISIAMLYGELSVADAIEDIPPMDYQHKSFEFLEKAQVIAEELNAKPLLVEIYLAFYEFHNHLSNFEKALKFHELYHKTYRSIFNEESTNKIKSLQVKHQVELLRKENEVTDRLLHNMMPPSIAARLKRGENPIATSQKEATVLFSDVVGFTKLSSRVSAEHLVNMLNEVFTLFDEIAGKYGLEKIKTIGDAYMVVGGLPEYRVDHAQAVALMALDMIAGLQKLPIAQEASLNIRVGIHIGAVVSGVIGTKKFAYDLWGDTVNTASRMESHGEPGRVHVSEEVYNRLKGEFQFEERGEIEVKGKGKMKTWWLIG